MSLFKKLQSRFLNSYKDHRFLFQHGFQKVLGKKRSPTSLPSLLALHDYDDWAIDHVFNLWFGGDPGVRITRANWDQCATTRAFAPFDCVLFGYYDMLLRFGYAPERSMVVIHDPCEIFPQAADWKRLPPLEGRLEKLKSLRAVIVISQEMEEILTGLGVRCFRIPTMSRLEALLPDTPHPIKDPSGEGMMQSISVYRNYPRKNAPLLQKLRQHGVAGGLWNLQLQTGGYLDAARYTEMLDQVPVYVCSSWQEGGPLPVMDALARGALPVMTRVGQIPEFLSHGETVFFCDGEAEFIESLDSLAKNPELLISMRTKAHSAYLRARDPKSIRDRVRSVFREILG